MGQRVVRLKWLVRRIGRMYWQEVPYRVASVCRSALQGAGVFTAARVPALLADHRFGAPWCATGAAVMPEASVLARADTVMGGDWSVYGTPVRFEQGLPDWNADPVTGTRIPLDFGLSIDFRHVGDGIDIKHLWELNRVLWWVPLAQAWAASGDKRYLDRLGQLLASWLQACPYARGANWSSPVEHAIRLINWSLVWHLIGGAASPLFEGEPGRALLVRWLDSIYQHMRFASDNYSFYSSADNHLIGEAAGVFVAAHTWDCWAEGRRLREGARRILEEEAIKQFGADGVNLEQAFCYHKFSLQFLLAAGLCGKANGDALSAALWARIESACVFMAALTDVAGKVPKYGDADDGDVWRLASGPQDSHLELLAIGARQFDHGAMIAKCKTLGEAVLPMASPTLGATGLASNLRPACGSLGQLPRQFLMGGYALLGNRLHQPDELRVLVDCGALGYNRIAGHGHADALSVLV